ncbi:hypothetical protein AB0N88_05165 [Streptomyces sp. NPDC093516]|uniref:hypothetical protein n=1 Tax=Streptomyces sp. NPDC093516 TaxID=3155304 RepID=UPI0034178692
MRTAVLTAALLSAGLALTACGGEQSGTGGGKAADTDVASLATPSAGGGTTAAPRSSDAADAKRPLLRLDSSEEEVNQLWNTYWACLQARGVPMNEQRVAKPGGQAPPVDDPEIADQYKKQYRACLHKMPLQPVEERPETNPHYADDHRAHVACLRSKGLKVHETFASDGTPDGWTYDDGFTGVSGQDQELRSTRTAGWRRSVARPSTDDAVARPEGPHPGHRTGRRLAISVTVLAVIAGATYAGTLLKGHGDVHRAQDVSAPSVQTTVVRRTDLSDSKSLPGTLGYGTPTTISGAGKGLVTKLPSSGATVTRGKSLFWQDDRPVTLFYGDTPVFRTLDEAGVKAGLRGADVTVLADNLKALGYDTAAGSTTTRPAAEAGSDGVPGTTFGTTSPPGSGTAPATASGSFPGAGRTSDTLLTQPFLDALRRWQRDTGQDQTGTLSIGQAIVLPGPVRIGAVKARLGDPAAQDVLSVTSLQKSVSATVGATDAAQIHQGDKVSLTLPDAARIPGEVTSVSTAVQGGQTEAADPDGTATPPSLLVTVVPKDKSAVKSLDAVPVQVTFTSRTRRNVLTVPVGALLALQEGGYALQRPDGHLIAVKTGLFAKGQVGVSGQGLEEGERVVTAG